LVSVAIAGLTGSTGSLGFAFSDTDEPTVHDVERLQLIAKWVGGALESTLYRSRAKTLVDALNTELMQQGHEPQGIEISGRYRPPWPGEPMGGDWFDAFTASGGTGVFVVGDVAGHGIAVAPTMIALRSYVRALAFRDPRPREVFNSIDQMLTEFSPGSGLLTIAIGMFDPASEELVLVNAGLPPLILKNLDGETTLVESGRSRMLGSGLEPLHDPPAHVPFRPGDTLVVITDGAMKPGAEGAAGMDDILDAVREDDGTDLNALAGAVLDVTTRQLARVDDATVLVMRATNARLGETPDG